uniref:Uncharacterized protein n=1 Tax=Octopus bimaculoides TaxID=37653 RepID=A0A0L8GBR3_OCTBM
MILVFLHYWNSFIVTEMNKTVYVLFCLVYLLGLNISVFQLIFFLHWHELDDCKFKPLPNVTNIEVYINSVLNISLNNTCRSNLSGTNTADRNI